MNLSKWSRSINMYFFLSKQTITLDHKSLRIAVSNVSSFLLSFVLISIHSILSLITTDRLSSFIYFEHSGGSKSTRPASCRDSVWAFHLLLTNHTNITKAMQMYMTNIKYISFDELKESPVGTWVLLSSIPVPWFSCPMILNSDLFLICSLSSLGSTP